MRDISHRVVRKADQRRELLVQFGAAVALVHVIDVEHGVVINEVPRVTTKPAEVAVFGPVERHGVAGGHWRHDKRHCTTNRTSIPGDNIACEVVVLHDQQAVGRNAGGDCPAVDPRVR